MEQTNQCNCNIVEIGYTENNKERTFKRNEYIPYNKFFEFLKTINCIDTYCSAYLYDDTKVEEANLFGNLYLDFDDLENINNAREDAIHTLSFFKIVYQIPSDKIKIYFSGHKGFHLIIPSSILGIEPRKDLNKIFKTIAEQIRTFSIHKTVDLKIYDNKRLFRVPNTINSSTGLYKIMLTNDELINLSIEEILELAKQPRNLILNNKAFYNPVANNQYLKAIESYEKYEKENAKREKGFRYRKNLTITPECIQNIIENGAEEGYRNITIACLTSFYRESGKSYEEILDLLTQWNSRNTKPTPEREMIATIKSIFYGDKVYGCSTLQTITKCNKSDCKLIKNKNTNKNNKKRRNVAYAIRID